MSRLIPCPLPGCTGADNDRPRYFLALPDEWVGHHAHNRDQAAITARERKMLPTLTNFAIAMALLEDWSLPGMNGNPEKWDFMAVKLEVIAWVSDEVLRDFGRCFVIPKNS